MFFYLDFNFRSNGSVVASVLSAQEAMPNLPEANTLYIWQGKQRLLNFDVPGGRLFLLGDPVFSGKEKLAEHLVPAAGKVNQKHLYQEVKGHYYWFYLRTTNNEQRTTNNEQLLCGNSFGAIYPVYYRIENKRVVVSSSSFELAGKTETGAPDKRNLLERLLFNYPFFNSTWWNGIKLLEAHRCLQLDENGATVKGDFEVSDYFGSPENTSRDSLPELAALFQKETELFFPDEPFAVSLTGGFDGRTLTAAARKAGRQFFTYSFGRPDSSDVTMPAAQAAALGIPYSPIYLDAQYVENASFRSAWDIMRLSEFNGNFGRPHYCYAARALSEKTNFILTGNFGSELFRALHLPGVMMSRHLINIFSADDDSWKDNLLQAAFAWDKNLFKNEAESLIADLEAYLGKMQGWDPNHKFYHFVFTEIFRKYFGAEIVMQSHYLNNRTPYLNLHFFRELNRTHWSGVHARLFEKVKRKRMKGQMFYATFIRQADPKMYFQNTNKGYSSADVLEAWRLPLLAGKVLFHKYIGHKEIDDNSVEAFIQKFHRQIADRLGAESPSFIKDALEKSLREIPNTQNLEHWVKIYSIAAGWNAANSKTVAAAV
jgi:hypothetical protein